MEKCDCGAETEGKWADKHSPGCKSLSLTERLQNAVDLKTEPRILENLCAEALGAIKGFEDAIGPLDAETMADLRRMLPFGLYDKGGVCTHNPVTQVYFRAGLLACREYMARFVEHGGNPEIAASIRANWWPQLGADPGPPRLFNFDEVAEEHEGPNGEYSVTHKDMLPSVEALPRAYHFLMPTVQAGDPTEPRQD